MVLGRDRRPPPRGGGLVAQVADELVEIADRRHGRVLRSSPGPRSVFARLFLAVQHAQGALDQGVHLVLAGIGGHAAAQGLHPGGDVADQHGAAGQAAGQQDAIHALAAEGRQQGGDVLADLVDHGLVDLAGLVLAGGDPALDLAEVGRAQQVHQPPPTLVQLQQLLQGVLAAEAEADQLAGRLGTGALRAEGALAVEAVVDVDVAALGVGADGDAAAHVAHDQVQVAVERLVLLGVPAGGGDLVQGVADDLAPDVLHARDLDPARAPRPPPPDRR